MILWMPQPPVEFPAVVPTADAERWSASEQGERALGREGAETPLDRADEVYHVGWYRALTAPPPFLRSVA